MLGSALLLGLCLYLGRVFYEPARECFSFWVVFESEADAFELPETPLLPPGQPVRRGAGHWAGPTHGDAGRSSGEGPAEESSGTPVPTGYEEVECEVGASWITCDLEADGSYDCRYQEYGNGLCE